VTWYNPFVSVFVSRRIGNTITPNAREGDPAVKITRKGVVSASASRPSSLSRYGKLMTCPWNDVVKLAHELNEVKEAQSDDTYLSLLLFPFQYPARYFTCIQFKFP
jgi:hypothetical protein